MFIVDLDMRVTVSILVASIMWGCDDDDQKNVPVSDHDHPAVFPPFFNKDVPKVPSQVWSVATADPTIPDSLQTSKMSTPMPVDTVGTEAYRPFTFSYRSFRRYTPDDAPVTTMRPYSFRSFAVYTRPPPRTVTPSLPPRTVSTPQPRREDLVSAVRGLYWSRSNIQLWSVERTNVWATSWRQLNNARINSIAYGFPFDGVRFDGETAYGGGLTREWFSLITPAISRVPNSVFELRAGSQYDQIASGPIGSRRDEYRAVGRLFALSIIEDIPLGINLPTVFFKRLLGQPIALPDIRELVGDVMYSSIEYVIDPARSADELVALWSPLYGSESDEDVTLANRDAQLAAALANVPINSSPDKFNQISAGLFEIIPRNLWNNWTPEAFAALIKGNGDIDIDDMERNLGFTGYSSYSQQVQWLLTVLREYDQPKRRAFLRFVTGSTFVSSGGFAEGPLRIDRIDRTNRRGDVVLPTTHTCFRSIDLPAYISLDELRRKVTIAVEADAGGTMQDR